MLSLAEELPPLQEAGLSGAETAGSKLVVLENLYMYGPHDGPLTESLPHAATDAKGMTRSRMSEALLAAHRSGRVRVTIGRASDFFGPGVLASQLGERAFAPLALLALVNPMVREVRAVGYQLYQPFVVDSGAFERTFGVRATPLQEALAGTVAWFRAREPRLGRGVALAKGLGLFTLDNLLIGAAVLAVRSLVHLAPALSVVEIGIAVAAGLYWLPPLRRFAIGVFRRTRRQLLRSRTAPKGLQHRVFEGPATRSIS